MTEMLDTVIVFDGDFLSETDEHPQPVVLKSDTLMWPSDWAKLKAEAGKMFEWAQETDGDDENEWQRYPHIWAAYSEGNPLASGTYLRVLLAVAKRWNVRLTVVPHTDLTYDLKMETI